MIDMHWWTPERTEGLKKMIDRGFTGSQIGRALGTSRNAVIGKVSRLRLKRPRPDPVIPRLRIRSTKPRPAGIDKTLLPELIPHLVLNPPKPATHAPCGAGPAHVSLRNWQCKWPSGDPKMDDFHFGCGERRVEGKPYCDAHMTAARPGYRANLGLANQN